MAVRRSLKSLIGRRRRTEDEGEDELGEGGPIAADDSQSEDGSLLTEPENDEDDVASVEDPATTGPGATEAAQGKSKTSGSDPKSQKARKYSMKASKMSKDADEEPLAAAPKLAAMADTEAMMNGLKVSGEVPAQGEILDFESGGLNGTSGKHQPAPNGHAVAAINRQRQEHEEYKKKRDSDPSFIPNRGNFFMHDTRGQPNGQPLPPRSAWQGRGRGRAGGNVGWPFSPANQEALAERGAEQTWQHDLHEAVNEEPQARTARTKPEGVVQPVHDSRRDNKRLGVPSANQPRVLSFSSTTLVGKVNIRVSLPGVKAPINFSEVPWKHYIRLPDHRPPLRRDKPVRLALTNRTQRYIFPSTERSFIFIPRQMRPNQHRSQYQRSVGGYGYSSRRTSMYGGSMYSASVAPSRRSSLAGISRERAFSPAGSFAGSFAGMQHNRPVVRLPHGAQHFSAQTTPLGPLSGHQTPTGMPQVHMYPLPQQPIQFGTPTTTVHQPRPQKTISVTGIESPVLQQAPHEAQPFRNQLPPHMHEQSLYQQHPPPPPPYFSPRQQYPYPQPQGHAGTPLSGIPEQAIHAPSFQPPSGYGQSPFYGPYPPQQNYYYYSPPGPNGYAPMPMYMQPPPPPGYMVPQQGAPMPPPPQPPQSQPTEDPQVPSGMVAHESNGMVFYVPASEAPESNEHYQPAESFVPSYAIPGLPTPPQDGSMPYFYPPQMQAGGMQEVGSAVYYPAQPQQ